MTRRPILWLILATAIAVGCSARRMAVAQAIDMSLRAVPVYDRESDVDFGGQAVAGHIKLLEGLLESKPDDPQLLLALTRSYSRHAFGYVQLKIDCAAHFGLSNAKERWTHQAADFYGRARAYGVRLLELTNPAFTDALAAEPNVLASELKLFCVEGVPALFWTAFAWGNELACQPVTPQTLVALGKAAQLMRRVVELDDRIMCGSAHLFLGSYYSQLPSFLGGDTSRAGEHFRRALEIDSGFYVPARLLQAEHAWRTSGDTSAYVLTLKDMVAGDGNAPPQYNLDNAVARRKAGIRLASLDSTFECDCLVQGAGL